MKTYPGVRFKEQKQKQNQKLHSLSPSEKIVMPMKASEMPHTRETCLSLIDPSNANIIWTHTFYLQDIY